MKIDFTLSKVLTLLFFSLIYFSSYSTLYGQTSVVTQHNNNDRTGWNNKEVILNTKNVKPLSFGKLYSRPVDDQLYAQLLIVRNVAISGQGNKNVIYAATVNNTVYAYDADDATVANPYWQVNLTAAGLRVPTHSDMTGACGGNYNDFSGKMGIVGTPVIDSTTNTIYVVARSCAANGTGFVQYLHALDITTGAEKANSPKLINAQMAGTAPGNVGGIVSFDPQKENQRCGLLLVSGKIIIAYASHCDWNNYHGWVLGYDKTTLSQTNVYNSTVNGSRGGIWMSGAGPSADAAGNIYLGVGNGSVGANNDPTDPVNRSESSIKLIPSGTGFTLSSYYTPNNYPTLEAGDLDFGSAGIMLLPNTNQALTGCKDGKLYLMDRDNMGGYNASVNNVVQTIDLGTSAHLRSSFAYYKGTAAEFAYSWSENSLLKAFPYNRATNKFDAGNVVNSGVQGPTGNNGAFLSVSSNGSVDSTAVLWTNFAANGDANQSVRPGILHAFDANDVTKELWNSNIDPADDPGNYAKFNCPTIANGKVYLASFSNKFTVYGLTGNSDTCNSTDIAINKNAFASSSENGTNTPGKAFDGDDTTRWASVGGVDPQYIYVDLGQRYDLCKVVLKWEVALGKNFTIDVSDDATTWTTLTTITNNTSFNNYLALKGTGKYVRMRGTARGTTNGYSLYSFEVYGKPNAGNCLAPDGLSTSDIYETSATVHWNNTGAANYNIQYKTVIAPDWITITSDTNMIILNDLECATDYLFKVQSKCNATDTSVYSTSSSFSQLPCGSNCSPLPTRWSTVDIGNTGLPGSACYVPDVYTIKGSGADIGGTADAFRFAFKTLLGDGEFSGRVVVMDQSDPANKAGIMIRETLSSGSKYVFIAITSKSGAFLQSRSATDGATTSVGSPTSNVFPYWIKLIKSGSVYAAYISADGINYTSVGSVDVGFGNGTPVYTGLAITSHDNTVLSTAMIDNYLFSSGVLPVKLLSFTGALDLNYKVNLSWSTSQEVNQKYFVIERAAADYKFTAIDSVQAVNGGSLTSYYKATDNSPLKGINFYRLKIVDSDGHFYYSALIMIRVTNSKAPLVYPNPAKTFINIAQGTEELKSVTIYDITGKAIIRLHNKVTSNITQMSIASLVKGTYIVEINTESNVYRDKLLVQ